MRETTGNIIQFSRLTRCRRFRNNETTTLGRGTAGAYTSAYGSSTTTLGKHYTRLDTHFEHTCSNRFVEDTTPEWLFLDWGVVVTHFRRNRKKTHGTSAKPADTRCGDSRQWSGCVDQADSSAAAVSRKRTRDYVVVVVYGPRLRSTVQ